jgi:hypothetical protein
VRALVLGGAWLLAAANLLVGALGAWRWQRSQPSRLFWTLLRGAQGLALLYALLVGVLVIDGRSPHDNLFYLYALLPLPVSFVAEQLRIAAAQTVLDQRELPDAAAVGRLPRGEQQAVVAQIVRREILVMALSALVIVFLAVRAVGTSRGF